MANQCTLKVADQNQTVLVDQYTTFQNTLSSKQITFKNIASNDYLVALGDLDDSGNLVAKKIVRMDPPSLDQNKIVKGQLQSISGQYLDVQTKQGVNQILTTGDTTFNQDSGPIQKSNLKTGQNIVAVLITTASGVTKARSIFIVPDNPQASPSASPHSFSLRQPQKTLIIMRNQFCQ